MMRHLVFDGDRGPKRFQLLWTAFLSGGDGKGERGPAVIRREARLQDVLEAISVPSVNGDGNPDARTLRDDAAPLMLTQEDFELLQQYAEKTPWTPRVSRDVVDLWDFLSAAPKQD